MNFWHILRVIKSRKWMIIGIIAITLIVVAVAAPEQKRIFTARAYVTPTDNVLNATTTITPTGVATMQGKPNREIILGDLITMAQGGSVFQSAIDFLALPVEKQQKQYPDQSSTFYRQIIRPMMSEKEPVTLQNWPDVLDIRPVLNAAVVGESNRAATTNIICIQVKVTKEEDAIHLANAVGYAFIEAYKQKAQEDSKNYEKFLIDDMSKTKENLREIQERISAYKKQHAILSETDEKAKAFTQLSQLEATKAALEREIEQYEATIVDVDNQLKTNQKFTQYELPDSLNEEVKALKEELLKKQLELDVMKGKYKPDHPVYSAQEKLIASIEERIKNAENDSVRDEQNIIHASLKQTRSQAQNSLAAAKAQLAATNASLSDATAKVTTISEAEPQLAELLREHGQQENIYNTLSDNLASTKIARNETTRTGSIVPVDWAKAATPEVEGPSRQSLMIYGFILSIILGTVLAVWLDSIDTRVRNASDVEKMLELPVIGLTPQLRGRGRQLPKLTHLYPLSAMAESYKILRTNILFELRDSPFKTLMISTGRPGQGGTTTICNIAISLAQIGKKIILIDADMRRPSLHRFFNISNNIGLSSLLQGKATLSDALQTTDVDNLVILPAGPQPLNPSELLGSDAMRSLVDKLEDHCDLVLFDSPSTVVFSDGPMLASLVDAVIMVVSANLVPRGTETQTRDLLRRAKANIIGVVVNRLSPDNIDSCYFYSHYYSDTVPGGGSIEVLELTEEGEDFDDPTVLGSGETRPELDEYATPENLQRKIGSQAKKSNQTEEDKSESEDEDEKANGADNTADDTTDYNNNDEEDLPDMAEDE